jgi:glycosyltransferase involved in cell wall biosynthesis
MLVRELIEQRSRAVKSAWLTWIESGTLAGARALHFTSQRELDDARALPLPLPCPFVLANGVELPAAMPEAAAPDDYALFLGRLSWKKRLDRLLRALRGTDIRLVLCGPDDEGLSTRLQAQIDEWGLGMQVQLRPAVSGTDKWELLAGARFLVLPSDNENFGNVVVESLAAGRPAVVTSGVGAGEVVRAADAGAVCDPSVESMGHAMRRLWRDRRLADAMGERGRKYVATHLTWAAVARSMADRYAALAGG